MPYLLDKLKESPDGDGTLLENTLMIYGSPMGDGNVHNHKRCPCFWRATQAVRSKGICT